MIELFALFALIGVGLLVFGALALVAGIFKLLFKVILFPVGLALGLVKAVVVAALAIVGVVLLAVVGPVMLGVVFGIVLPLVVVGLVVWGCCALVAAAV